jgi:hypothetical protein
MQLKTKSYRTLFTQVKCLIWEAQYNTIKAVSNHQPLAAEIGRTHNALIMSKHKRDLQKEYYIGMFKKFQCLLPTSQKDTNN